MSVGRARRVGAAPRDEDQALGAVAGQPAGDVPAERAGSSGDQDGAARRPGAVDRRAWARGPDGGRRRRPRGSRPGPRHRPAPRPGGPPPSRPVPPVRRSARPSSAGSPGRPPGRGPRAGPSPGGRPCRPSGETAPEVTTQIFASGFCTTRAAVRPSTGCAGSRPGGRRRRWCPAAASSVAGTLPAARRSAADLHGLPGDRVAPAVEDGQLVAACAARRPGRGGPRRGPRGRRPGRGRRSRRPARTRRPRRSRRRSSASAGQKRRPWKA